MLEARRFCGLLAAVAVAVPGCSRNGRDSANARPVVIDTSASFAATGSKPILVAAMEYPKTISDQPEVPISLTASDGSGLALTSLRARAVIDGPLAFTELHLRFHNPEPRVREGRFSITLPASAAISRLAMRIDTGWQEAEVVERHAAHIAYEDFLHRRQDPALLEKEAGNQFSARIFPIPASGDKELIVSYSHELAGGEDLYQLPLRGLPEIGVLDVQAQIATGPGKFETVSLAHERFVPDRDFAVQPRRHVAGLAHGDLIMARIRPPVRSERESIGDLVVLFDTSASRALGFTREVDRLGELVAELGRDNPSMRVTVATFDQSVGVVYAGPVARFGKAQLDAILARRPLGASDLGAALAWARGRVRERLLVVSDGIATAGDADRAALRKTAQAIGADRIDAVITGGIHDEETMRDLVQGCASRDGVALAGDTAVAQLGSRLSAPTVSGVTVSIAGARWVWPSRIDGAQAGDELLVFAEMKSARARGKTSVTIKLSGPIEHEQRVALEATIEPLLRRAWTRARIARLERERAATSSRDRQSALKDEIIALSTRYRVLSDHTALLVLETEDDYRRFGIERRALSDILVAGKRGVELLHRNAPVVIATDPVPVTEGEDKTGKLEEKKRDADPRKQLAQPEPGEGPVAAKPTDAPAPPPAESRPDTAINGGSASGVGHGAGAPTSRPAPAPEPMVEEEAAADEDDKDRSEGRMGRRDRVRESGRYAIRDPMVVDGLNTPSVGNGQPAYTGEMAEVMKLVEAGKTERAVVRALAWRSESPGDVMALIALGESLERRGSMVLAARAYGSIIDLFPGRADLRRFAGARLHRLGEHGLALAADSFDKAVEARPDHMTGHRLLAYAHARAHRWEQAFAAIERGLSQSYPDGRFAEGERILREDLGILAAAWLRAAPARKKDILRRLAKAGSQLATVPSLRFVLNWETDANDVDFHVMDAKGGHAFYSSKELPSGGALYADVTTGYGPECFAIQGKPAAFPYRLFIHYYSRGPMGYGMGQVEILSHDGHGGIRIEDRPFVVMNDGAGVDLGNVTR